MRNIGMDTKPVKEPDALQDEVTALKAEKDALEKKVATLEKKNKALEKKIASAEDDAEK